MSLLPLPRPENISPVYAAEKLKRVGGKNTRMACGKRPSLSRIRLIGKKQEMDTRFVNRYPVPS